MSDDLKPLEDLLGHSFENRERLQTALTHSSVASKKNYERLEFLGDRVLGLVIAELLYKRFPDEPEGDLAKRLAALVQGSFLAKVANEMNLGGYIKFSDGEAHAGGAENENILADVFESLMGALYLDGGFEKCQAVIHEHWADRLDVMKTPPQHPKTRAQEWTQSKGLPLPTYEIASQTGPDHAPVFEIRMRVDGHPDVIATGKSRQIAEKDAAKAFMAIIDEQGA